MKRIQAASKNITMSVKGEIASKSDCPSENDLIKDTIQAEDMLLLLVPAEQHHYWKKERGLHSIGPHCLGFC